MLWMHSDTQEFPSARFLLQLLKYLVSCLQLAGFGLS